MKRTLLRILVSLIAFTAGLTLSHLSGLFTSVDSPPQVTEVKPVESVQLAIPAPPPPIPMPIESPKPTVILDYDINRFSPDGTYVIKGRVPKAFEKFDSFWIYAQIQNTERPNVGLALEGQSESSAYEIKEAVFALVTQKKFVFVTTPFEDGFEYRFDGQFLRSRYLLDYPEGTPVLQGTLTKSRNGKTVAEATVTLEIAMDGC